MRRFVPAELHGLLDYMTVGLFVAGGKIFGIEDAPPSVVPGRMFGIAICMLGPLTDYGADSVFSLKNDGVGLGKISPKVPKADVQKVREIEKQIKAGKIADIPTQVQAR